MFGFANALLLALLAAAGVDLVLALRRKAVGQLFTVPHYLFGDWGGEARAMLLQNTTVNSYSINASKKARCPQRARASPPQSPNR